MKVICVAITLMFLVLGCGDKPSWPESGRLESVGLDGKTLTLKWPEPVGEFARFTIRRGDEVLGQVEDGTSFEVNDLSGKTNYEFSVVAENAKGKTSSPLIVSVTTGDVDPPFWKDGDVLNTSVESRGALGALVRFSWPPAEDDTAVEKYRLMKGSEMIAEIEETEYSYQSIEVDGDYQVIASDSAGNWSKEGLSAKVWANRGLQNILRSEGLVQPRLMRMGE